MTAVCENKLRWQSRRGTLELDLILERFWRRTDLHTEEHLRALSGLLSLDDEQLRRAVAGEGGEGGGATARGIAGVLRSL